jgi:hypothetical protein
MGRGNGGVLSMFPPNHGAYAIETSFS